VRSRSADGRLHHSVRDTSKGHHDYRQRRRHRPDDRGEGYSDRRPAPRRSTETKASLKTTELIAYLGAVIAVIITAYAVGGDGHGSPDPFGASEALRYITWLTIGYMIARGLAQAPAATTTTTPTNPRLIPVPMLAGGQAMRSLQAASPSRPDAPRTALR